MYRSLLLLSLFASICLAKSQLTLSRGGLGFIFSDPNSYTNPASLASIKNFALELKYQKEDQQIAMPSFAFGNNKMGFGAYGRRLGSNLKESSSSTDYVGVGFGFKLFKEYLVIGLLYDRLVDESKVNDGVLSAAMNLLSSNRTGPAFGINYKRTLNQIGGEIQSLKVAVGYLFSRIFNVELIGSLEDINQKSNYEGMFVLGIAKRTWYLSAMYQYLKANKSQFAHIRLGIVPFKNIDFSLLAKRQIATSGEIGYGATFRLGF